MGKVSSKNDCLSDKEDFKQVLDFSKNIFVQLHNKKRPQNKCGDILTFSFEYIEYLEFGNILIGKYNKYMFMLLLIIILFQEPLEEIQKSNLAIRSFKLRIP